MSAFSRLGQRVDEALSDLRGGETLSDATMNLIGDLIIDLWDTLETYQEALDELDGEDPVSSIQDLLVTWGAEVRRLEAELRAKPQVIDWCATAVDRQSRIEELESALKRSREDLADYDAGHKTLYRRIGDLEFKLKTQQEAASDLRDAATSWQDVALERGDVIRSLEESLSVHQAQAREARADVTPLRDEIARLNGLVQSLNDDVAARGGYREGSHKLAGLLRGANEANASLKDDVADLLSLLDNIEPRYRNMTKEQVLAEYREALRVEPDASGCGYYCEVCE